MTETMTNAERNAHAWLAEIIEHYAAYSVAAESQDYATMDEHADWALESALDVQVRESWHGIGQAEEPSEFLILLTTGGPACRIWGELNQYAEPGEPDCLLRFEHQDWGTDWVPVILTEFERNAVQWFAQRFYFGR